MATASNSGGAYSVDSFCEAYGIGRTKLYEEIKQKRLRARKLGTKTLILRRDAEEWEKTLPALR